MRKVLESDKMEPLYVRRVKCGELFEDLDKWWHDISKCWEYKDIELSFPTAEKKGPLSNPYELKETREHLEFSIDQPELN